MNDGNATYLFVRIFPQEGGCNDGKGKLLCASDSAKGYLHKALEDEVFQVII